MKNSGLKNPALSCPLGKFTDWSRPGPRRSQEPEFRSQNSLALRGSLMIILTLPVLDLSSKIFQIPPNPPLSKGGIRIFPLCQRGEIHASTSKPSPFVKGDRGGFCCASSSRRPPQHIHSASKAKLYHPHSRSVLKLPKKKAGAALFPAAPAGGSCEPVKGYGYSTLRIPNWPLRFPLGAKSRYR